MRNFELRMELTFQSNKVYLEIKKYEQLSSTYNNWTISDEYIPNTDNNLGDYTIILKTKITQGEEQLNEELEKGEELAKLIGNLITYIIGRPLDYESKYHYGFRKRIGMCGEAIVGWSNNYEEIKTQFDLNNNDSLVKISISDKMKNWSIIEESPLQDIIIMLSKYEQIDNITRLLIYYHTSAARQDNDIKHLLLGKSLEIVDFILPKEKNKQKRLGLLPNELKKSFGNKNLSWLFEMSNFRMETRHIINKNSNSLIHNKMTDDEYYEFLYISDNLISYVVREKFGLDFTRMIII